MHNEKEFSEIRLVGSAPLQVAEEEPLVRYDLRERQCKRFETIIKEVVRMGMLTIPANKASEYVPGVRKSMNSRTLYCRLKDALLGFRKYQYATDAFPVGYDLTQLVVCEMPGERVRIATKTWLAQKQVVAAYTPASTSAFTVWEKRIMEFDPKTQPAIHVVDVSQETMNQIMSLKSKRGDLNFVDYRPKTDKLLIMEK